MYNNINYIVNKFECLKIIHVHVHVINICANLEMG